MLLALRSLWESSGTVTTLPNAPGRVYKGVYPYFKPRRKPRRLDDELDGEEIEELLLMLEL